jgi:hypothetical protein
VVRDPDFGETETVAAMRDPHVVYLRYRLLPVDDATEFRAPSLDLETADFSLHVGPEGEGIKGPFFSIGTQLADADAARVRTDMEAVFTFKVQHRTERAAREAVRPFSRRGNSKKVYGRRDGLLALSWSAAGV